MKKETIADSAQRKERERNSGIIRKGKRRQRATSQSSFFGDLQGSPAERRTEKKKTKSIPHNGMNQNGREEEKTKPSLGGTHNEYSKKGKRPARLNGKKGA